MLISLIMSACTVDKSVTNNYYEEYVVGHDGTDTAEPTVVNTADTASTSDTGSGSDTETTSSSGCEDGDVCLLTQFTTAWSATVPFGANPGTQVNLGAILFASNDLSEMYVMETNVQFYVNTDPENSTTYTIGENNGITAADILEECWFSDVYQTTTLYSGPPMAIPEDGHLVVQNYTSNGGVLIWLTDGIGVGANIKCVLRNDAPTGVAIAVDIDLMHGSTAYSGSPNDEHNVLVREDVLGTNGVNNGDTIEPVIAVIVND